MKNLAFPIIMVALIVLGFIVLIWMSPIPADRLTPAQTNLIDLADTMVKGALGAIFGFAGSRYAANAKGGAG